MFFLTDWIPPWIPQLIALAILCVCIVFHFISLIKNKEYVKLIFIIFICLFLIYFHTLGSLLGIFIATFVYLVIQIFENQIIFSATEIKKYLKNKIDFERFYFLYFFFV
ncbi:hypothetical protein LEP1GSC170_2653 [Leptospira interrogans serovar Bataviae str. HAI135]|nr:hypothetical protein LEP1GSC170_2653 [Leptospira interrogans serovar Bataviae str. HAI135]